MSEIMRPMEFSGLMGWALAEYKKDGRIFGIEEEKFYQNKTGKGISIFGQKLASPVGPAAGPNSQLAQNIVAAWLCGSRFIELKTVQKMDGEELRACVPRPCINAEDEGYNVEWSTELTIPEALGEYVKAWVAIHALTKELGINGGTDVVFNMSVGYDLDGIKTEKINSYIEGMKDASATESFKESIAWLKENRALFTKLEDADIDAIPANVSQSITLSTLHGCPPDEIERIAKYLLDEKKVHTFIKCNPTLLGYETARRLLDEAGFGYISFDDHHFNNDLQFDDATAMLGRLMEFAKERSLAFGVKITNTFPVKITSGTLPGEEMYMSGRALFHLSINVAAKLSQAFGGKLPISYSGGADAFNIAEIFKTGIQPITVATTILKPGGYERTKQLCEALEPLAKPEWKGVKVDTLNTLAESCGKMQAYLKDARPAASRKITPPLGLYDCFVAPCKTEGCPIGQQIPEYLKLVSENKMDEAFKVIAIDNPCPGVTGEICPHTCQSKCTRMDYDEPLKIRAAKRTASEKAQKGFTQSIAPAEIKTDKKAVVVGAGPAGIAAASFLRRAGMAVTVLEKREKPYGIVQYVIPAFRVSEKAMTRDFEMAKALGVEFKFGTEVTDIETLRQENDYVILATGAWKEGAPPVKEGAEHVLDALAFLEESKANNCNVKLGRHVAVIGGGDVAMDCARAAKRAPGVGSVTIVYRRTKEFMPASAEELKMAVDDGVAIKELHAPVSFNGENLICEKMQLGNWDESGRRDIDPTGENNCLQFDSVICATGARIDTALFEAAGIELNEKGRPKLSAMCETNLKGVYLAGDCKAGPATVVKAVADAKMAVSDICAKLGLNPGFAKADIAFDEKSLRTRKGVMQPAAENSKDGARCLGCEALCEVCCDVCPNRANIRVYVPGFKCPTQIVHIDSMCNECGNCGVFCPHTGNPYKDKLTVFACEEDFKDSENIGFLRMPNGQITARLEDRSTVTCEVNDAQIPEKMAAVINTLINNYPYCLPN